MLLAGRGRRGGIGRIRRAARPRPRRVREGEGRHLEGRPAASDGAAHGGEAPGPGSLRVLVPARRGRGEPRDQHRQRQPVRRGARLRELGRSQDRGAAAHEPGQVSDMERLGARAGEVRRRARAAGRRGSAAGQDQSRAGVAEDSGAARQVGMRGARRIAALTVMLASRLLAQGGEPLLHAYSHDSCVGGMAVAATCVTYAPASEGGPTGGTLRLAGVPPGAGIRRAVLYWSIMSNVTPVITGAPSFEGVPLAYANLGEFDGSPCFPPTPHTAGFRADVTSLVPGDGTYAIGDFLQSTPTESWVIEGATLIVVYENQGGPTTDVVIDDGIGVTTSDGDEILTTIDGFNTALIPGVRASIALAAGNGQAFPNDHDPLYVNATNMRTRYPNLLSGALCPAPGPEYLSLYDLSLFDVTGLIAPGDHVVSIRMVSHLDCYSLVAIALSVG